MSYERLRRFDEMRIVMKRALTIAPNDPGARLHNVLIDFYAHVDTEPARAALEAMIRDDPN